MYRALSHRVRLSSISLLTLIFFFITACGGATTPSTSTGLIGATDEPQEAVVQIETEGGIVPRGEGQVLATAGAGSGFIIDPSGIVVTNNHVVTGAATIRVHIGGKEQDPTGVRATVLGASECSDLAVLQLDGNGPYRYLEWFDGEVGVRQDVFALGFPLGDPEFTATRGIISKARTDGRSSWASVDTVIEHDAAIRPGNSGGPLITPENKVIGVNYASNQEEQFFAIGGSEATDLIENLRAGNNVNSIGINAEAVTGDSWSGIYVASVKTGSPADQLGIQPGDYITSVERTQVGEDGTMSGFCDILISQGGAEQPLLVEVWRPSTESWWEGRLNVSGGQLAEVTSFAPPDSDDYSEYTTVRDETGALEMEVPVEWNDIQYTDWNFDDQRVGPMISASPDVSAFSGGWETPGVLFGVSRSLIADTNEQAILDTYTYNNSCTYGGRQPYEDALYTGYFDTWENCGGGDTTYYTIAFAPEDRAFVGLVGIQVVSEADSAALDRILDTFQVVGNIP